MLAVLLEPPRSREAWDRWGFHHRTSHDAIRAAVATRQSSGLTDYPIYPIQEQDFPGFLERNSTLHIDMNGALKLAGQDLEELDPTDERKLAAWIEVHYREHLNAETALGIAT